MKQRVTRFRTLATALKELEPFVRNGEHLRTGKPFKKFDGMRSREMMANWLICAVKNSEVGNERYTFTGDPTNGDGFIHDTETDDTWSTENVMVPPFREGDKPDIESAILRAIATKQAKGGAAYASGKTLVVFIESGANTAWYPNRVAKQLPELDFEQVLVVGLQRAEEDGSYIYGVTALDISAGNAPMWLICVNPDFETWQVQRLQDC